MICVAKPSLVLGGAVVTSLGERVRVLSRVGRCVRSARLAGLRPLCCSGRVQCGAGIRGGAGGSCARDAVARELPWVVALRE